MNSTIILVSPPDLKVKIEEARNAKKWTRAELASKLKVQEKVIKDYETGNAVTNNLLISQMETHLGVKLPRAKKVEI